MCRLSRSMTQKELFRKDLWTLLANDGPGRPTRFPSTLRQQERCSLDRRRRKEAARPSAICRQETAKEADAAALQERGRKAQEGAVPGGQHPVPPSVLPRPGHLTDFAPWTSKVLARRTAVPFPSTFSLFGGECLSCHTHHCVSGLGHLFSKYTERKSIYRVSSTPDLRDLGDEIWDF